MITIKSLLSTFSVFCLIAITTNCSSAQKLQEKSPVEFGDIHFQKWTAGVKGGGSGINLYIPVKNEMIKIDSIYFRGQVSKAEVKPKDSSLYIGRFDTKFNQSKDIILSSDSMEEAKNKLPVKDKPIPFELENDECVISYSKKGKTLYYKISDLKERAAEYYPSTQPNRQ